MIEDEYKPYKIDWNESNMLTRTENLEESKKIQNRFLLEFQPGPGFKRALKYKWLLGRKYIEDKNYSQHNRS
jgi:hypothetical protein